MKSRSIARLGAGILLMFVGIAPMFAQSGNLAVTIPFDFTVGDTRLAAGSYEVKNSPHGVLYLRNRETGRPVMIMASLNKARGDQTHGQLFFTRYGDAYFLDQVDWPGYADGLRPVRGKVETGLAKNQPAKRVIVAESKP